MTASMRMKAYIEMEAHMTMWFVSRSGRCISFKICVIVHTRTHMEDCTYMGLSASTEIDQSS